MSANPSEQPQPRPSGADEQQAPRPSGQARAMPTLPANPPPAPLTDKRMPSLSTLISQGGPGRRHYTGGPAKDKAAAESAIKPPPRNGEALPNPMERLTGGYTTLFKEAIGTSPPPHEARQAAAPAPTPPPAGRAPISAGIAARHGTTDLFKLPAGMPAPPPPRATPPSIGEPVNAEDIPVSRLDPEQVLKPSRRSHQSPYQGLQRFEVGDAKQYFGPRQLLVDVLDALDETSLLCLTGPPAGGKSSLFRAGVIPNWLELEGEGAQAFVFSPGDDPFLELSYALEAAGCGEQLVKTAREPAHYVFQRLEQLLPEGERWLILVDQFEEAARSTEGEARPRDAAFMASLVEVALRPASRIKLVLSLRDDFFWKLGQYPALAREADRHLYRLIELTEKEVRHAVTMPAQEQGVEIEPALVRHLLTEIAEVRPALPLLQHVLDVLWIARQPDQKQLRLDDYLVLGGLSGALRRRLETIYSGLSPAGKGSLRQALLRLLDVSGRSAASRGPGLTLPYRMTLEDFTEIREREAVEMLIAARLLMYRHGRRTEVELPVEAYLAAWPRFRRWVEEIHEAVALRNQLTEDAARWKFNLDRRGSAAGAKELWKGGHLQWALELRERGDFDSLLGGLSRDETGFLDASREALETSAPPAAPVASPTSAEPEAEPTPVAPPPIPAAGAPTTLLEAPAPAPTPAVVEEPAEDPNAPPSSTGSFYPSADANRKLGGPELRKKVQDSTLEEEVRAVELQHELIARERQLKLFKLVTGGLGAVALLLGFVALKSCGG